MRHLYPILAVFALAAWGCDREDDTISIPEGDTEYGYHVPQGDNRWDDRIVGWNEKMDGKMFILYKFTPRDVYWNNYSWLGMGDDGSMPDGASSAYRVTEAQTEFVDGQLKFIEDHFLSVYPEKFLKGRLPQKILLAAKIEKHEVMYPGSPAVASDQSTFLGFDNMAITGGDGRIEGMDDAGKLALAKAVHGAFFDYIASRALFTVPQEFADLAPSYLVPTGNDPFYMGFLGHVNTGTRVQQTSQDFAMYLKASLETLDFLKADAIYHPNITPKPKQLEGIFYYDANRSVTVSSWWSQTTYTGIGKDKSGNIRQKYKIMLAHMKREYGVDMLAISNALNGTNYTQEDVDAL